jgi:hypothetical protein
LLPLIVKVDVGASGNYDYCVVGEEVVALL